ncbi:uncharacterized conserved protein [Moesziomyces antarcticus T-34]|uniref:Uncharacterized conserved protein n=1 Tax=Pseudozyma antarctica (strain T-34) TaxID=1151754 RepID=M9M1A0_PSEA3|nr:uncharacterized conserved protein [Moesziomyces antarcticus T-34]
MAQLLTSELTSLGVEARRKHPEIKQAADAALARIKAEPDAFLSSSRSLGGPPSDHPLLRPVLLSCETKLPKVISLAMALLQRILLQKLLPDDAIATVITALNKLLTPPSKSDVDVQLKILQIASALLTTYPNIHNADLSGTLMLGFKLHEGSKVAVVSSTAAATLRQSVMAVFDKVKDEDAVLDGIKGGGEEAAASAPLAAMSVDLPDGPVTLFPSSRDAYLVFSDLCSLANAEPASFLFLHTLSKTFSLELIESVLSNHQRLFSSLNTTQGQNVSHPELLFLLRSKVCPLLIKSLSEPPAFPIHLRLMRLLFLLLRQFSSDLVLEVEILLSILLRTVNPSAHEVAAHGGSQPTLWQQVLALEVVRSLCSDDVFLRNLWLWYDSGDAAADGSDSSRGSAPVFAKLVNTLQSVLVQSENVFAMEPTMQDTTGTDNTPDSPRRSRIRPSADRSFSGLYEAAAGVASAAMSQLTGSKGTESLSSASSPTVQIIDQLDKVEAPSVASAALPKTYLQLLALQSCHLLTQSMAAYALPLYSKFVNSRKSNAAPAPPAMHDTDIDTLANAPERDGLRLTKAMLRCSALPLSDVLVRYLRIKCTDSIFEETLLAFRNLTNVTGALDLVQERDVLLTRAITFAVPRWNASSPSAVLNAMASDSNLQAVSTRSLACLRAFLQVAYYLSGSLGAFWYPVFSGLCGAHALLSSRYPSVQASDDGEEDDGDVSRSGRATLSTLTHSSMTSLDTRSGRSQLQLLNLADLQPDRLQAQIQSIFDNSAALEDDAFLDFISSLCRLSDDMMQQSIQAAGTSAAESEAGSPRASGFRGHASISKNESASAFYPISCLDSVTALNTKRLCSLPSEQGWELVAKHLTKTLSSAALSPVWRSQASQAANKLAFGTMSEAAEMSGRADKLRLQEQALRVISSAGILEGRRASLVDLEVRTTSVENLNKVMETFGHSLTCGWELVFDVCSATCKSDKRSAEGVSETSPAAQRAQLALVKAGFSCLQLVCSDFLSVLDPQQIQRCCSCLNDFGSQDMDVNVALTANGCLWGVTAEMAARAKARAASGKDAKVDAEAQPLWLFMLQCLLSISQSTRSEVRNGAISNLFRVLQQYGDMLESTAWQEIVETIILPLIKLLRASASDLESGTAEGLADQDRKAQLMGVQPSELKQWQESRCLALTQFGEVVRAYLASKLIHSPNFEGIWSRLLELTRTTFVEGPADLSQAAIKCFTSILSAPVQDGEQIGEADREIVQRAWRQAWNNWVTIGRHIRGQESKVTDSSLGEDGKDKQARFTQKNLLAYIQAFPPIYRVLEGHFDYKEVETLLASLKGCVSYAQSPDNMSDRSSLTNVQEAARATARSVAGVKDVPALILSDLSECVCLAHAGGHAGGDQAKSGPTFVALSRTSITEAFRVFVSHEDDVTIYTGGAFESLISALVIPIKLKYDCPDSPATGASAGRKDVTQPMWQLALLTFCRILSRCCPKLNVRARKGELEREVVERLWSKMIDGIEAAISADSSGALQLPRDVRDRDERFGLFLLGTIENFVLPYLGESEVPDHLIDRVGRGLAVGSKLYSFEEEAPLEGQGGCADDVTEVVNERFGYWCLDLLFLGCSEGRGQSEVHRRLATALLKHLVPRCEQVLRSYARDLQIRGAVPMPRVRQEEINHILLRYIELRLLPNTLQSAIGTRAWHSSKRAHLFSAFRLLLALASVSTASKVHASIGTSQPESVVADTEALAKSFTDAGLQLGVVGTTRDVLGAKTTKRDKAETSELATEALALIANELGVEAA